MAVDLTCIFANVSDTKKTVSALSKEGRAYKVV